MTHPPVPLFSQVFNFDPEAVVRQRCQQPGKAEEDMTKLCNHRRKVVAMAALCRSMQVPPMLPSACGAGMAGPHASLVHGMDRCLLSGVLPFRFTAGRGELGKLPRCLLCVLHDKVSRLTKDFYVHISYVMLMICM